MEFTSTTVSVLLSIRLSRGLLRNQVFPLKLYCTRAQHSANTEAKIDSAEGRGAKTSRVKHGRNHFSWEDKADRNVSKQLEGLMNSSTAGSEATWKAD